MYFHKSPDALAPDGSPEAADANAVAMAAPPAVSPGSPVPDVTPPAPGSVPPVARLAVPDRPIPALPSVAPPTPVAQVVNDPTYGPGPVSTPPLPVVSPEPTYAPASPGLPYTFAAQSGPLPKATEPQNLELPPKATLLPPKNSIFELRSPPLLEKEVLEDTRKRLEESEKEKGKGKEPPRSGPQTMTPFPPLPVIVEPGTQFVAKTSGYPLRQAVYEPGFVIHRRLHFEERNAERYGWDLGIIQPVVSTLFFYRDVMLWPQSLATSVVTGAFDTNAGKCLPGSPTPYSLYPPGLTLTGSVVEASVIVGLLYTVFP